MSTEKNCRLYSAGGQGVEMGRREDVDAKRWWISVKGGREWQGKVRVM